jgi:hypothetical protein
MRSLAPKLLEVQRAMRESLIEHRDDDMRAHVVAGYMDPGERLDVYRNTSASVLTTALRLSYPAVQRLVGKEFFDGTSRIFATGHPPKSACLDDYGAEFPQFLEQFAPAGSLAYLPEVARLEWAVNRALHANDTNPLDPKQLEGFGDFECARVTFVPHPSIGVLRTEYPVDVIWRAVLEEDDAALATVDLNTGPIWLLIERLDCGINVQRMSELAWRFTAELCSEKPLHAALEAFPDYDASVLLADHLAKGRFVDVRIS